MQGWKIHLEIRSQDGSRDKEKREGGTGEGEKKERETETETETDRQTDRQTRRVEERETYTGRERGTKNGVFESFFFSEPCLLIYPNPPRPRSLWSVGTGQAIL
jgi:hypothetical protein